MGIEDEQIELADFLLIAEAVLLDSAETIARACRIPQAESALAAPFAAFGGVLFYEDPAERAAIVCSRIIRNHPLIDGNKRVGYLCMREQLHRAGLTWQPPSEDERVAMVERLAAGEVAEAALVAWVQRHTS